MDALRNMLRRFKVHADVVGLDIGEKNIRAARLRREKSSIRLVAAGILPRMPPDGAEPVALALPKPLRAPYAALAVAGADAVIKLLSVPGRFGEKQERELPASLGLAPDAEFRMSYSIVSAGHGRSESRVLAVALPEAEARAASALLPKGRPAPCSIEVSGLCALSGFTHGDTAAELKDRTVGVVDGGATRSTFAVFHRGVPILIRRFDVGAESAYAAVGEQLGVAAPAVEAIMASGAVDISGVLERGLEAFLKQLVISKEFVERRENCRLTGLRISGGLAAIRGIEEVIGGYLGITARKWNPFKGLTVAPDAVPEELSGQEMRFAAACGAARNVLGNS